MLLLAIEKYIQENKSGKSNLGIFLENTVFTKPANVISSVSSSALLQPLQKRSPMTVLTALASMPQPLILV